MRHKGLCNRVGEAGGVCDVPHVVPKLKEATEQDKFLAAVDLPLAQAIVKTLSVQFENGGKCFFEKKLLLQKEQRVWSHTLFEIQAFSIGPGAPSTSTLPFGLAESRCF